MKLTLLQKDFSKALALASRFVSIRAQLPILSNIVLSAKDASLTLLATNLEISVATKIGAKVQKPGEIALPARVISDLVSSLNPGTIFLESQKESVKISSDNFSGKVAGMNTSDFPAVPQVLSKPFLDLSTGDLLKSLSHVLYSVSSDDTRPVLTGVLTIFDSDYIVLVASDGFRLSQSKIKLKKKIKSNRLILPKGVLSELLRINSENNSNILFQNNEKDNQVLFGVGDVVLASRVIEGEFPNFEKIIPKESKVFVNTDKEELLRAVKTASVFARDSANIIKIKAEKEGLTVSAESTKSGTQSSTVDAKVEGGAVEVSYNYRFIEEFLNSMDGTEVAIELTDNTSPGVFRDIGDKNYFHLIMPVRA